MLHYVARSVPGTLLIHDWREGVELFHLLAERAPDADLVVMPDHVHVLTEHEIALAHAMSAFARWRNHDRGVRGPVWEPAPGPSDVGDAKKQRRTLRYVYLNPCRAKLVTDPLAWPLSTYREAVGLALSGLRDRAADPSRLHAYVAKDDDVARQSFLPCGNGAALVGPDGMRAVEAAVSEALRLPFSALRVRGPGRTLLANALRALVDTPVIDIAAFVGADPRTIRRAKHAVLPEIPVIRRLILDPRFPGLPDGDLRRLPAWERYAYVRRNRSRVG